MAKVNPALFAPFFQEAILKTQNIISMGVVQEDVNAQVSASGEYFTVPFQENLENIGAATRVTNATTITPQTLNDFEEVGVVCHFGQAISDTNFDNILRGAESLKQAAGQIVGYTVNQFQNYLVAAVKGCFATALASHEVDCSGIGSGVINTDFIIDTAQSVMGEQYSTFDTIIVHSKIFADLVKMGLVTYVNAGTFGENLLVSGDIPTILGKKVIINDTLCAIDANSKYPTYLSGGKPIYLGYQRQQLRVYDDFDPALGGGTNKRFWYADFVPHVFGMKWDVSTKNPTLVQLATGSNWSLVWESKNIKLARLLTFGS